MSGTDQEIASPGRPAAIPRLRVLDAGTGLPTAAAARLLGAAGATVLRVRRTVPDPFRELYPALSSWARTWTEVDAEEVEDVLGTVDVCLVGGEDHPDACAPSLDVADLLGRHDRLVVLQIGGYVPGTSDITPTVDLLVQARTGFVFEQFSDRPTQIAFAPPLYGAALLGVIGVWAALLARRRTGRGQLVNVTLQQALALFWPHLWLTADRPDAAFDAVPPRDVRHLVFGCADGGFVQIVMGVPAAVAKVHGVLGIPGPVDPTDRGAPSLGRGAADYFGDRDLLGRYVATFPRAELIDALAAVGVAAEPVLAPGECLDDPQVRAAGLAAVDAEGREYAADPVDLSVLPGAAPLASARAGAGGSTRTAGEPPLAGIRVIDLGNWVAGPFASKLLADLGADVISVEPPTGLSNLTGLRNTWASNRGKRSIVVDLGTVEGRDVVHRLAATADAVHHNFRIGVAERLGVGPDQLRRSRPDLVYLHTTAYGASGPRAGRSGFDMVMQALCGHEVRAGGIGNEPVWYRSPFVDYGAGALGAIGLLAALYERAETGRAVDVHTSLLASAMFVRGEWVRDPDGSVVGGAALAADRCGFHPAESLYRTADGWIAVAARGERMTAALAAALDLGERGPRAGWGRDEHRAVAAAVRDRRGDDVLAGLARAGVWATRCADGAFATLLADEPARRAHLVISAADQRFGHVTGCFGPLINFADWSPDPATFRSAPLPGEHSREVLAEIGYSDAERARLERDRIVVGADEDNP